MIRSRLQLPKFLLSVVAAALIVLGASMARADLAAPQGNTSSFLPITQGAGVTEELGHSIPLDLTFYNEQGQPVPLRNYFKAGRPVILQLGYFRCPMLCDLVTAGMVETIQQMHLVGGKDFEYLFISINPGDSPNLAFPKRESIIEKYNKPAENDGFHLLCSCDLTQGNTHVGSTSVLADLAGYKYTRIGKSGDFTHPACLIILTPDGHISRYLYGVSYDPQTVRLSLVEASAGAIGHITDDITLLICSYDAGTGKYTATAVKVMQVAGMLTVLVMGVGLFCLFMFTGHHSSAIAGQTEDSESSEDFASTD